MRREPVDTFQTHQILARLEQPPTRRTGLPCSKRRKRYNAPPILSAGDKHESFRSFVVTDFSDRAEHNKMKKDLVDFMEKCFPK
jgi:hypothetical protein